MPTAADGAPGPRFGLGVDRWTAGLRRSGTTPTFACRAHRLPIRQEKRFFGATTGYLRLCSLQPLDDIASVAIAESI